MAAIVVMASRNAKPEPIEKTDMSNTLDALTAFSTAAELGSFSAAARYLHKSQSTVSEAIANLEIDLGVSLFDRGARNPVLTAAGEQLLRHARQVLAAHEQLTRQASLMSAGLEPQLSIVLSDTLHSLELETLLQGLETRFPELELETLVAEKEDVVDLVASGRAHLGLLSALPHYPAGIGHAALPHQGQFALFAGRHHPLARQKALLPDQLAPFRQLCLNTLGSPAPASTHPRRWLAPSYLMLLDMTRLGFGWAELPSWMAQTFGRDELVQLDVAGWPRPIPIDLVWSSDRRPGLAAAWVRQFLAGTSGEPQSPA